MGVSSQQHATKNFSRLWWDVRIILRGKLQILSTWRRYSTTRYCSEKIQETIIWFLIYLTKYSQLNGLEYTILSNERIFVNDSGRNWRKVLAYYSALISEYFRGEDLRKNKKHFSLPFDTPAWNCNKIYFSRDKHDGVGFLVDKCGRISWALSTSPWTGPNVWKETALWNTYAAVKII